MHRQTPLRPGMNTSELHVTWLPSAAQRPGAHRHGCGPLRRCIGRLVRARRARTARHLAAEFAASAAAKKQANAPAFWRASIELAQEEANEQAELLALPALALAALVRSRAAERLQAARQKADRALAALMALQPLQACSQAAPLPQGTVGPVSRSVSAGAANDRRSLVAEGVRS